MATDKYWQKRALKRLVQSEKLGTKALKSILPIYEESMKNIDRDIQSLYKNYANKGILDVTELRKILTPIERRNFVANLRKKALELHIPINQLVDERYLYRLTRLQALKEQIKLEIQTITNKEQSVSDVLYTRVVENNYEVTQEDLAKQGFATAFSTMDKAVLDSILKEKWFSGNYSSRIYDNVTALSKELPIIMGSALSTGTSYQKTSRLIRDRFNVSKYEATRLVRTETNYFHNQAELQSYEDDNIKKYRFDAELDRRTSRTCRRHNGKIYKITDAQVGVNYPPLHPHCRSTTSAVFSKI